MVASKTLKTLSRESDKTERKSGDSMMSEVSSRRALSWESFVRGDEERVDEGGRTPD